jgi:curved DNA-binding protein CbpA
VANAYEVLGVRQDATFDEIRRAYRQKAFALHPDRMIDQPAEAVKKASEEFAEVAQAWEILRDENRRQSYDRGVRMEPGLGERHKDFDGTEVGVDDILIASVFAGARRVFSNVSKGSMGWDAALLVIGVAKERLDGAGSTSELKNRYPDIQSRQMIDSLTVYSALCFTMDLIDRDLLSGSDGMNAFIQPLRDPYQVAFKAAELIAAISINSEFPSKFPKAVPIEDRLHQINRRRLAGTGAIITRDPSTIPCRICGSGPTKSVALREVRGRIFAVMTRTLNEPLCSDCGRSLGRIMQANTLSLGWWGLFAAIMTPFYALINAWNLMILGRMDPTVATKWSRMPPLEPGRSVWKRKRSYVSVVVLFVVLSLIGGALGEQEGTSSGGGSSSMNWKVGDCVDFVGSQVRVTSCGGLHDGVIIDSVASASLCPRSATKYSIRSGRVYCIR